MEGICGIVSFDHKVTDLSNKIVKMVNRLSDGEPLNHATICGNNWALAHAGWVEPYWHPNVFTFQSDTLKIAGIADIFNLEELAARYHAPVSNVGEVIAACYLAGGESWPGSIRGSFAIIIFDIKKQLLNAVTDPIGIRPLCWYRHDDCIYLSSRIDAIRQVNPGLQVDPAAIFHFMHYEMIPSPGTIYHAVNKLEPGFMLNAEPSKIQLNRYWDISATQKIVLAPDVIAREVYDHIKTAVAMVKKYLAMEDKIGCFLSGGTDSSTICGLISKMMPGPVSAFSIGFAENDYDEMFYARSAAAAFNLNHTIYYVKPGDMLAALPLVARIFDEPFGNSSIIPAFFCAKQASAAGRHYLIAGDGGDEIFGGNERYSTQQIFRNYYKIPKLLRTGLLEPLLLECLERIPIPLFHKAGSYIRRARLPEVDRIYSYRYITDQEMFEPSFLSTCDLARTFEIAQAHFNRLPGVAALDRHLYLDMKLTITDNDLRKVTRTCDLAHTRVYYPLLDLPVIDLGFAIPVQLKLKGSTGLRFIFKEAFRELLPQTILTKKKHGFGLPFSQWLRTDPAIQQFAHDVLFDSQHLNRGYFRKAFINDLWKWQLNDTTSYYGSVVWLLLMLELWHRHY